MPHSTLFPAYVNPDSELVRVMEEGAEGHAPSWPHTIAGRHSARFVAKAASQNTKRVAREFLANVPLPSR